MAWIEFGARPAADDTSYALISGSPHLTRWSTPVLSSASPLPTRPKSTSHAWIMRAATSVSFESHLSSVSLRPLMPPAALHHWTNAVALSNSSWLRPGWTVAPGSDIVPTRIEVSVTPLSVAPFALPGPQTSFIVPKSPALVLPLPDVVVPPFELLLLDRLHPAAIAATTTSGIHQRNTLMQCLPSPHIHPPGQAGPSGRLMQSEWSLQSGARVSVLGGRQRVGLRGADDAVGLRLLLVDEAREPEAQELRQRVPQEQRGTDDGEAHADQRDDDVVLLRGAAVGVGAEVRQDGDDRPGDEQEDAQLQELCILPRRRVAEPHVGDLGLELLDPVAALDHRSTFASTPTLPARVADQNTVCLLTHPDTPR